MGGERVGTRLVVAIGGNALLETGSPTADVQQFANAFQMAGPLVELIDAGCRLVITHGNGPQVGAALVRSELAAGQAYTLPYDCCVASTQGEIGYVLQFALWQRMQQVGLRTPVVTVITQVRVDRHDPAFARPTKPVGPFETAERAERLRRERGYAFVDAGPRGFRRVVPSPAPREIVEVPAIRACLDEGLVVIAAGGGGVPVFNDKDLGKGVEAVIDKDLTSALLAVQVEADLLVIVTGEPRIWLDYGRPGARPLDVLTASDARRHLEAGQFPEGSMGPKVEAALYFLEHAGRKTIVTNRADLVRAVEGRAGTHIVPDGPRLLH
ncbi:MAG TPA: carbamate kinase [Vicinamibacteria bacterium]|nr:carbamate kinase [Vicinamibacteria bacterium]